MVLRSVVTVQARTFVQLFILNNQFSLQVLAVGQGL
jgi:hypothetical protein